MDNMPLYNNLFNLSPLPAWIYQLESFQILDVNEAAVQHYGYSKEEFLARTIKDLRPASRIPELISAHSIVHEKDGNIYFGVFTHVKKSGQIIRMKINGHKVDFNNEKAVLVICQDVTEEETILNQLKTSEKRLSTATAIAKLGYWRHDIVTKKFTCTDEVYKIWGQSREDFNEDFDVFFKKIHPADQIEFKKQLKGAYLHEVTIDFMHRVMLSENEIRWVHELGRLVKDEEGNPIAYEGTAQDITLRKIEEERLKLLESVTVHTNDAVLITEAEPTNGIGRRIVYVNDAFTRMTGYSAEESIGKSPRFLQGPNSDEEELARLQNAIENWESCQISTINYKKNGEEFWVDFTVSPIANERGWYTHWVAVERDITEQKEYELEKLLLNHVSLNFSFENDLTTATNLLCKTICEFGKFYHTEIWLLNEEKTALRLLAHHLADTSQEAAYSQSVTHIAVLPPSNSIPNEVWAQKEALFWEASTDWHPEVDPTRNIGLNCSLGVPVRFNNDMLGVLIIGSKREGSYLKKYTKVFEKIENFIGSEIKRKKLENDLNHLYDTIPDIVCLADFNGRFLKINQAGCDLLGYSESEILFHACDELVHPEDVHISKNAMKQVGPDKTSMQFENRYITKSGDIIWLSWTCNSVPKEQMIYATAKNITREKKLSELNRQANSLAKIGSWEVDFIKGKIYWSDILHELHETDPTSFVPNMESGVNFYKEEHRNLVQKAIEDCANAGIPFDFEAIIITSTKKERWVRAIGNGEYMDGKCTRIYGSFQDIHERKEAELRLQALADNLPGVVFQYHILPDNTDFLTHINEDSKRIWGFSAEEVMQDNQIVWTQIKEGGDYEAVANSIAACVLNKTRWNISYRYVMPSGEVRTHLGFGIPNFLTNGNVVFNGVVLDITKETQNEELLKQSTEMARIGSWELNMIGQDGDSMYWSPITKKILEVDELYNPSLTGGFEFYTEESKLRVQNKVAILIEQGQEFDEELLLITAKGNPRWVRCIGKSTRTKNKCVKIYGSFQDIHASKMMELQIREILGSISDAFYALDKNWNFTYFNKEAEHLLLRTEAEVIGQNIWELFAATRGTLLEEVYYRVAETGKSDSFDYYYPGDAKWYEINAYPWHGGVSVYFKNIDEKKQAEELLRKSYEEKNTILESIGDAFFSMTKEWTVTYWNKEAEQLLGKKREAIVGKHLLEAYPDLVDTDFEHMYQYALESQKNTNFEAHYANLNMWFEISAYPSSNGLSVYFKDISLRKQADIQLLQANERFEKVTEATNDAIWDWDLVTQTLYRSNGIERFFGPQAAKLFKQEDMWKNTYDQEQLPQIIKSINSAIEDPTCSRWEMDYTVYNDRGEKVYVIDRGLILRDTQGKATRMVGAMTDITEQKNHEIELLKLNQSIKKYALELEVTNEELEQFAFIASHDLQEPLRMITSFLEQLRRKYNDQLDDKAQQYIHFATDGAKRLKQIILDLLDYSRAGKLTDNLETVDLNEVLAQYRLLRGKVIEDKQVIINAPELPVFESYIAPLTQTIHCLIDNAIKYCPENRTPVINISAIESSNHYTIQVKDNGIGIDPLFFEKIFIMFQRLHNRENYAGNGIGLSIAKKHVESWGGKIWLESTPSEGSTFYFTQPKKHTHHR